jgi:hypothetical protein
MTMSEKLTSEEWFNTVAAVLAEHPDYAAATVQAMQDGLTEALDRKSERLAAVSMGLHEALSTKPDHVKRNRELIVTAIKASTLYRTPWSAAAIAKERMI